MARTCFLLLTLATQHLASATTHNHFQSRWKETVAADVVLNGYHHTFSGASLVDCARQCSREDSCLSFGVHQAGGATCWLYRHLVEFSSNGTASPGTRYFERLQPRCPSGYRRKWGSCYRVMWSSANWTSSSSRCKAAGGRLFSGDTPTKFQVLRQLPRAFAYWIGGNDFDKEGEWRWWSGRHAREHWQPGEPNDNPEEDCMYLRDTSRLRTRSCSLKYPSVCEVQV